MTSPTDKPTTTPFIDTYQPATIRKGVIAITPSGPTSTTNQNIDERLGRENAAQNALSINI